MGYETPEVKMVVVEVEQGFALSPGGSGEENNPDVTIPGMGWG